MMSVDDRSERFIQPLDGIVVIKRRPNRQLASVRQDTLVNKAADSHIQQVSVTFRHAFAVGRASIDRRALKLAIDTRDQTLAYGAVAGVGSAMRTVLNNTLKPTLLRVVKSGGEAGLAILKRQMGLRAAEFNPDQPRDEKGQWTSGGASILKSPVAGSVVDGRTVRDEVPNYNSIHGMSDEYEVLPGIREVSMSDFDPEYEPRPYSVQEHKRLEELVSAIRQSNEISPLIVVVEAGERYPYILEGGHRFDALHKLKAKSFPAVVVHDTSSMRTAAEWNEDLHPRDDHGKFTDSGGDWPISDDEPRIPDVSAWEDTEDYHRDWAGKLTAPESDAIENYMDNGYIHVNRYLRVKDDMLHGSTQYHQFVNTRSRELAEEIESAIDKAPEPPPPELVWRGVSGRSGARGGWAQRLELGTEIEMKGFQSTTLDPSVANGWGRSSEIGPEDTVVFEIKPTKGAYLPAAAGHMGEYEYTLPHAARYRVVGKKQVTFGDRKYEITENIEGGSKVFKGDWVFNKNVTTRTVIQLEMLPYSKPHKMPKAAAAKDDETREPLEDDTPEPDNRFIQPASAIVILRKSPPSDKPKKSRLRRALSALAGQLTLIRATLATDGPGQPDTDSRLSRALTRARRYGAMLDLTPTLSAIGRSFRTAAPSRTSERQPPSLSVGRFVAMRFDVRNPLSIDWAKRHAGSTVEDVSRVTERRIREAIYRAWEDGDFEDAYEDVLAAVGDDDRASQIARTETMMAANQGQRDAWVQAVDEGLLERDAERVWIATEIGACPICEGLDGETTTLDGEYSDGSNGPPAHPNCRCTEGIH